MFDLLFWIPASGANATQQAYELKAISAPGLYNVSTQGVKSPMPYSGAFSKSVTFSSNVNGTSAVWVFTGDTTGKTYFTANVTYSHGPIPSIFTFNVLNVTSINTTSWTVVSVNSNPGASNPSTTEAYFNNEGAFFEIKSGSTSFTTNGTTVSSPLAIATVSTTTSATMVVDFSAAAYVSLSSNTTSTDNTYTVYVGAGSPPGGHVVLIIIICVAAGVVLSIIIFVVIYLRRRRNYERID